MCAEGMWFDGMRTSVTTAFAAILSFGLSEGTSGIALAFPLENGKAQLHMVVVVGSRQYGSAAVATR